MIDNEIQEDKKENILNSKRNIKLLIEYLGTNYCGFQRQINGISIQQKIEEAILKATGEEVTIYPSGRTDAGVHALGQVANFFTHSSIPVEKMPIVINFYLPKDIKIKSASLVSDDFNSRKSAKKKTYIYKMYLGNDLSVFDEGRVLPVKNNLDLDLMQEGAKLIVGEHDFSAFVASKACTNTTIRTIYSSKFIKKNDYLYYEVTGNGFLYNMVRILVGTLLDVGAKKITLDDLKLLLKGSTRNKSGKTVSPSGLYLKEVFY